MAALLGRHIGQLKRGQRATRFQQTFEPAENNGPALAATFDVLFVHALRVEFADREPNHIAESIDLERDYGSGQMTQFLHPLDVPRYGEPSRRSDSSTFPWQSIRPSAITDLHGEPTFQSDSMRRPKK